MGRGNDHRDRRRQFGGQPEDHWGDFAPPPLSYERPTRQPSYPSASGPETEAKVKWFNPDKGFGFVEMTDGSGEAFLHIRQVEAAGHTALESGTTLMIKVGAGQKGPQVQEIVSVDTSTAEPEPPRGARPPRPRVRVVPAASPAWVLAPSERRPAACQRSAGCAGHRQVVRLGEGLWLRLRRGREQGPVPAHLRRGACRSRPARHRAKPFASPSSKAARAPKSARSSSPEAFRPPSLLKNSGSTALAVDLFECAYPHLADPGPHDIVEGELDDRHRQHLRLDQVNDRAQA